MIFCQFVEYPRHLHRYTEIRVRSPPQSIETLHPWLHWVHGLWSFLAARAKCLSFVVKERQSFTQEILLQSLRNLRELWCHHQQVPRHHSHRNCGCVSFLSCLSCYLVACLFECTLSAAQQCGPILTLHPTSTLSVLCEQRFSHWRALQVFLFEPSFAPFSLESSFVWLSRFRSHF